jgi:hypothetical protein
LRYLVLPNILTVTDDFECSVPIERSVNKTGGTGLHEDSKTCDAIGYLSSDIQNITQTVQDKALILTHYKLVKMSCVFNFLTPSCVLLLIILYISNIQFQINDKLVCTSELKWTFQAVAIQFKGNPNLFELATLGKMGKQLKCHSILVLV